MTLWTDHIRATASKNKITYKAAMTVAASSWTKGKTSKIKKQIKAVGRTKKDKADESKGMTGQTKGKTSKTKEDFTTTES